LTGGVNYKFKVRSRNIYGYGAYSSETTIEASDVPLVMAILSTSIVSSTKVRTTWTAPFDSYEPITEYQIMFLKSDGTYAEDTTNCDGTDVNTLYCDIEMNEIRTLTGLTQGTLIQVIGRAKNLNGWGDYSQVNVVGVVIETEPSQMTPPVIDISTSSNT
jgi:hypothetical protein